MNGTITNQLTVWCAFCEGWEYLDSKKLREAHQEAKQYGWTLTQKNGWVCPKCNGNACQNYWQEWHSTNTCSECAKIKKNKTKNSVAI